MHGFLLFMFGASLCFGKDDPNSMTSALKPARYIFVLMGFFSFYNGLLYNDFSSAGTKIFGDGCWSVAEDAVPVAGSPGYYYAT